MYRGFMQEDNEAMTRAAKRGNFWKFMFLVRKRHVNINWVDDEGRSPLYNACEGGYAKIAKALIVRGSRGVNAKTNFGWTPLLAATFHGQISVIELLMANFANVNFRDDHGCSVLHLAASSPKLYLVDTVNKKDRFKRRAVRKEAFMKHIEEPFNPLDFWKKQARKASAAVNDATGKMLKGGGQFLRGGHGAQDLRDTENKGGTDRECAEGNRGTPAAPQVLPESN